MLEHEGQVFSTVSSVYEHTPLNCPFPSLLSIGHVRLYVAMSDNSDSGLRDTHQKLPDTRAENSSLLWLELRRLPTRSGELKGRRFSKCNEVVFTVIGLIGSRPDSARAPRQPTRPPTRHRRLATAATAAVPAWHEPRPPPGGGQRPGQPLERLPRHPLTPA